MLVNASSREPVLSYLAKLIRCNERRAQIHVEERHVAGDGPMINLLSVLQQLCFKVIFSSYFIKSSTSLNNSNSTVVF